MAWMRLMGADSVTYHKETVLSRADDHPGQALAYYASRGETPLAWGGSGAERLGLAGPVTEAQYEAVYGPGGACDPTTGTRLTKTTRPGMELVISAHKSVAELGVIGRAEHMHSILDAERDATLSYLDEVTRTMGGRRGRARAVSATSGLVYAHTRHATSRAGDPCPHDHVLLANVVDMRDDSGGWKAPDMALWRDHLHAATMVGRVASARKAVMLGYRIEADDGRSGRLRHWRISGIPCEVLELHSKRAAEISKAVEARGTDTYRSRAVAARDTRREKHHTPVAELVGRWRAELSRAGYSPELLLEKVDLAGTRRMVHGRIWEVAVADMVTKTLSPEGPLEAKVFARPDVIVAVAPELFGYHQGELHSVVDAVLASAECIPLIRVAGARERHWAAAHTLATELAIEQCVARGVEARGPEIDIPQLVYAALHETEEALGHPLSEAQTRAVWGICGGASQLSLVLGVAGSGKTTTLSAVRAAYEAAGFEVLGTATSGQAARTLHNAAGVEHSRTLASLLWRLDHQQLSLSQRHVVILDEAGMTEDPRLLRLLLACENARAKVVLVGDDRQLGPVGPGGALGALMQRHPYAVHVLSDNVRQSDEMERAALAQLRAGDVGEAVSWYVEQGRVRTAPSRDEALDAMVQAWAEDALAGKQAAMYAWRRDNVTELNQRARDVWREAGRLHSVDLEGPGGRRYASGDPIVTLAPGADGRLVTSQRGEVVAVYRDYGYLIACMDDGEFVRLKDEELGADRLDHAYAVTVHRSQGATVEVAHRFEDGGGRELGYVAMSRAKEASTVWVVADDLDQAREDLVRDWSRELRPRWAIDTSQAVDESLALEHERRQSLCIHDGLRRARLEAEARAVVSAAPPDLRPQLAVVESQLRDLDQAERDLQYGRGVWEDTAVDEAYRHMISARHRRWEADKWARSPDESFFSRHKWKKAAQHLVEVGQVVEARYEELAGRERKDLNARRQDLEGTKSELTAGIERREEWLAEHPEVGVRLEAIGSELTELGLRRHLGPTLDQALGLDDQLRVPVQEPPRLDEGLGLGLGR